jgi:hypothetical protein
MAYSDFTLTSVREAFHLDFDDQATLFPALPDVSPGELLRTTLAEHLPLALAIHTEKARSELLIAPILVEVRRLAGRQISLFSGLEFPVEPEHGLNGVCDFVLSQSPEQLVLRAPVVVIIEAKNENIKGGLAQCIAALVAAQRFNLREGNDIATVYGAVTTGTTWRFLRLTGSLVAIDQREYYIDQVDSIIAVLLYAAGAATLHPAVP